MENRRDLSNRIYIDLFAGCGGLSLGLHEAGWEGLFAIERDPMAFETFQRNFLDDTAPYKGYHQWPEWLPKKNLDIVAILQDEILRQNIAQLKGKVTLVAGGPPCQGFSVGGMRDGKDSRNQLVHRFLEFVELVRPTLVLIENVEGIAKRFVSKPGAHTSTTADEIVKALSLSGYSAGYIVANASRFGVPQVRRRVFILGVLGHLLPRELVGHHFQQTLEHVRGSMLTGLGLPVNTPISAGDALHDLNGKRQVVCPDSPKFMAGTYVNPKSTYARLMRRGIPSSAIPNSHRFSQHGEQILNLYKIAHQTQPKGRLSKKFLVSMGTKKDKKVLLDATVPSSTITTHPDEFIHYAVPRNVTVREMARLQSFPDDFWFYGRYTINGERRRHDVARCSQVGNAVPPLLARAVGLALSTLPSAVYLEEFTPTPGATNTNLPLPAPTKTPSDTPTP